MTQVNMVEVQAAVPASSGKNNKWGLTAPKAKAGSSSNSFSKQLQKLTRRSDDSSRSKEAVAERSDNSIKSVPAELKSSSPYLEKPGLTSPKTAEQELSNDLAAVDDEAVNSDEIEPEDAAEKVSDDLVVSALGKVPELPQGETVGQGDAAAASNENSSNPGLVNLLNELTQDIAPVVPLQENSLSTTQEEQVKGYQQAILPEADLAKLIAAAAPITQEAAVNNTEPVVDEAKSIKQVLENQLLPAIPSSISDPEPLPDEIISAQLEMAADAQKKLVKAEAEISSGNIQPAQEAAVLSESPAASTVLAQIALASQPAPKRLDSSNPGSKTPVIGDEAVKDNEGLLTRPNSGAAVGSEQVQAGKSTEGDKTIQTTGSKENEAKSAQNELKFRVLSGLETKVDNTQTQQAATDVKKLIDFESKRIKTDTGEVVQPKSEAVVKGEKSEADTSLLLPGKTGWETDKAQIMRNQALAATSDLNVEPEQVLEQIVKKAEMMVKQNSSEMKIQLQPEFMGKMTIKLLVEEGVLTAKFFTDSHQVKQMLDSNLNTLRQSLEAQGIRVEKTEVNVQLNNGGMFDGSGQNPQESWQRHQFMSSQYQQSFNEPGYQTGADNYDDDEITAGAIAEPDYGLGSNGTMNFLI